MPPGNGDLIAPWGPALLFATPKRSLDFFERREIFLQPVDMLLHLHNGRPEFLRRAERSAQLGHLRLCGPLAHGPAHESQKEHPTEKTEEHPPPYVLLVHTALLCGPSRLWSSTTDATARLTGSPSNHVILGLIHAQINAFSPHFPPIPNATLIEGLTGAWSTSI